MSNTIELNFKADTFEEAISQAIVAALGSGMCPREIIAQLISRGFLRDPGNNALEDVVRGLADRAETAPQFRNAAPPVVNGSITPSHSAATVEETVLSRFEHRPWPSRSSPLAAR